MSKTILLAGATGLVGSAVLPLLLADAFRVINSPTSMGRRNFTTSTLAVTQ